VFLFLASPMSKLQINAIGRSRHCVLIHFKMDERDRRAAIIALYLKGNSPTLIIKKMGLTRQQRSTVYNVIRNYKDRGSYERQKSSTSRKTLARKVATNCIRNKIARNPVRSQRKLAAEHGVSAMMINRILKDDLHLTAYKSRRRKMYLAGGKEERLRRAKTIMLV
jgi:cation transport regulator ChaB